MKEAIAEYANYEEFKADIDAEYVDVRTSSKMILSIFRKLCGSYPNDFILSFIDDYDVNETGINYYHPYLVPCVKYGRIDIFDYIVNKYSITASDIVTYMPNLFYETIERGNIRFFTHFIDNFGFTFDGWPLKYTPLCLAVKSGSFDLVQILIDSFGMDPKESGNDGRNVFTTCIYEDKLNLLRGIKSHYDSNIMLIDKNKHNILTAAAEIGEDRIIKELVRLDGIRLYYTDGNGFDVFTTAAKNGNYTLLDRLAKMTKVTLMKCDAFGRNIFTVAATFNQTYFIDYVSKKYGYDCLFSDDKGDTAFSRAIKNNNIDVVQYLIEKLDVDPYDIDGKGEDSLSLANRFSSFDVLDYLNGVTVE